MVLVIILTLMTTMMVLLMPMMLFHWTLREVDTDADGIGNNADTDDDNDGVADVDDAFPLDASESLDTDGWYWK